MARKPKRARPKNRQVSADSPAIQSPLLFSTEKIKQLYIAMLGCRVAAERGRLLVQQGKFPEDLGTGPGREAAEVGALIDLLADDCTALEQRDLTARFIRAVPLKTIFADLYARQAAGSHFTGSGRNGRAGEAMTVPGFSPSTQLSLITGVAWSLKRHGRPNVAVAFSEDDAATLDPWRDAVRFSVLHKLPIIHVVHGDAVDGVSRSGFCAMEDGSPAGARRANLPIFAVDGNDVVAVYRVAQEAIRRARQGYGPALIECQVARGQASFDGNSPAAGTAAADPAADPIAYMEAYLRQKNLWSDQWKRRLTDSLNRKLDAAVDFAEKSIARRPKRAKSRLASAS